MEPELSHSDFAARVQALLIAPRKERAGTAAALLAELAQLAPEGLEALLCAEREGRSAAPRAAAAGRRLLLRACAGRSGLAAARLLQGGASAATLLAVAEACELADLPPAPGLAAGLAELLLGWRPPPPEAEGEAGGELGGLALLRALRRLGLLQILPEELAEQLLSHALSLERRGLSSRHLRELGEAAPAWRRRLLSRFLDRLAAAGGGSASAALSEVVKVAQDWGAHEDPGIFSKLEQLLYAEVQDGGCAVIIDPPIAVDGAAPDGGGGNGGMATGLPRLAIGDECVVMVDRPQSEELLMEAALEASEALLRGDVVRVAMDAEWRDPRPLSLLQLAVALPGRPPSVFLVDMLARPSAAALSCCRELLLSGRGGRKEVYAFSPHEDLRRLRIAGVLPQCSGEEADKEGIMQGAQTGRCNTTEDAVHWIDLQLWDWGLGLQPSLQSVVQSTFFRTLDKKLQTSDWDRRPLTEAQVEYAALDASVLLRLWSFAEREHAANGAAAPCAVAALTTPNGEAEKDRWHRYRMQRRAGASMGVGHTARERNADLRFVLPAPLCRLMRQLRGIGLDSIVLQDGASVRELTQVALDEDRLILIQSSKVQLPKATRDRAYHLRSRGADDQLREVINVFGMAVDAECLCGRCVKCNAWDWRLATREELRHHPQMTLSERTLESYNEFWLCGGCGKVYWHGSMFDHALDHFRSFLPAAGPTHGVSEPLRQKYEAMKADGLSERFLRARMVQQGDLTPGGAAAVAAATLLAPGAAALRAKLGQGPRSVQRRSVKGAPVWPTGALLAGCLRCSLAYRRTAGGRVQPPAGLQPGRRYGPRHRGWPPAGLSGPPSRTSLPPQGHLGLATGILLPSR